MERTITEVVAALLVDGNRFLVGQRPAHKARGGLWEFVGGKLEPGETREEALIRECREEMDVTVIPGEVYLEVLHEYPDLTVHLTLLRAKLADGSSPVPLEHNELRWITAEQIDELPFCPADDTILERLKRDGL